MTNTKKDIRDKIRSLVGIKPKENKSDVERTPDGQRIITGMSSVDGRVFAKWDRDIPYDKLINRHTKSQVTPEQVEAAKYFANEEGWAMKQVKKLQMVVPQWIDDNIRDKLVIADEQSLEKMVEEYNKEKSDPEYKKKMTESRKADVIREMNEVACERLQRGM